MRLTVAEGFHLRVAGEFARIAQSFGGVVSIMRNGKVVADGKSIFSILAAGIEAGAQITIHTTGPRADFVIRELARVVNPDEDIVASL